MQLYKYNYKLPIKFKQVKQKSYSLVIKLFNLAVKVFYKHPISPKFSAKENNFFHYLTITKGDSLRSNVFTFSFIALAAQIIQIDNKANKEEINALIACFPPDSNLNEKIYDIFYSACEDADNDSRYAYKLLKHFSDQNLHYQILNNLIKIALADGYITNSELSWLKQTATIFNFDENIIWEMVTKLLVYNNSNPYKLFNLNRNFTSEQLTSSYRLLVKTCHPDHLTKYADLSHEYLQFMQEKFSNITNAYNLLKQKL